MTTLIVTLPRRAVLSANHRLHWRAAAKVTADLRHLARLAVDTEGLQPVRGVVDVVVTVAWPDRRRRDVPNLAPTYKALLDGLVDGNVLPDDSDGHVRRTTFQTSEERCARGHVRVQIELVEVEPCPPSEAS